VVNEILKAVFSSTENTQKYLLKGKYFVPRVFENMQERVADYDTEQNFGVKKRKVF